jgi:hypothetical protein
VKTQGILFKAFAHATAAGIVIVGAVGLAVLGYFGLLAWAIVAGSPIGSPLALLGMVAMAFLASLIGVLGVLFPVTITADLVCRRALRWSRFAQIPVATILCLLEVLAISAAVASYRQAEVAAALKVGLLVWLVLLVPLGIYWWVLQANDGVKWAVLKVWTRMRGGPTDGLQKRPAG